VQEALLSIVYAAFPPMQTQNRVLWCIVEGPKVATSGKVGQ